MLREDFVKRLRQDLVGPNEDLEVLREKPSDRYLTGILFPKDTFIDPEEDESLGEGDEGDSGEGEADASPALFTTRRPSTAGLSFTISSEESSPVINVQVSCGEYTRENDPEDGRKTVWRRHPRKVSVSITIPPDKGVVTLPLDEEGLPEVLVYLRITKHHEKLLVSLALINERESDKTRRGNEERSLFQVEVRVSCGPRCRFLAREIRESAKDDESIGAALIYRNVQEYAVGHTCSAGWVLKGEGAEEIYTDWIPREELSPVTPDGSQEFRRLDELGEKKPRSAEWLSRASKNDLIEALTVFSKCYSAWIERQKKAVPGDLPEELKRQADKHLKACEAVQIRMKEGVRLLEQSPDVLSAFRLANQAMDMQMRWNRKVGLNWRPFQLGFQLLVLPSLVDGQHSFRDVMDLLWFPTGGGKTEAYLFLIAFITFFRRFSRGTRSGAGVAAFMRYTLRLLTLQQFQRAASMICACELMRRYPQNYHVDGDLDLGDVPFSLGLWVGSAATPNDLKTAYAGGEEAGGASPRQLKYCPICMEDSLQWGIEDKSSYPVKCANERCESRGIQLPVWTVDEDIFREAPTLVIATVDKFAQITRKSAARSLFGIDREFDAPDLIIQDELHLITGPLGTIAALYEIAIDEICARSGRKPKVVGSTATIRRATDQVKSLFDRGTAQFPPPGIIASDSGFAKEDSAERGRLYVGVSTAGRSAKLTLQAVCASLLQASNMPTVPPEKEDSYWTLVAYFNSLRELGGARVMMLDDVPSSIKSYAGRRGESERLIGNPEELTSNRKQSEIPQIVAELGLEKGTPGSVDVLLATNMISVGIDIPRLSMMVVNGQPKGMSEYIQATSRVGRDVVPGLVVSIYNAAKPRDRSHFESFKTWHAALYRHVEATSVTPFASRARDKALRMTFVTMARYLCEGMMDDPSLDEVKLSKLRHIIDKIIERADSIDPEEVSDTEGQLRLFMDEWQEMGKLTEYWSDSVDKRRLIMSAEEIEKIKETEDEDLGLVWHGLNSMREVEPGALYRLMIPKKREGATNAGK